MNEVPLSYASVGPLGYNANNKCLLILPKYDLTLATVLEFEVLPNCHLSRQHEERGSLGTIHIRSPRRYYLHIHSWLKGPFSILEAATYISRVSSLDHLPSTVGRHLCVSTY